MYSQTKGQESSTFDEEGLIMSVLDLFVAGSETTSTTLRWAFLYMAKYPEIQGKITDQANNVCSFCRCKNQHQFPFSLTQIHNVTTFT